MKSALFTVTPAHTWLNDVFQKWGYGIKIPDLSGHLVIVTGAKRATVELTMTPGSIHSNAGRISRAEASSLPNL
jgi:hypothetical protein